MGGGDRRSFGDSSRCSPRPSRGVKSFRFIFLRTLLHSPKSQLFSFHGIAHSLRKTPGGWGTLRGPDLKLQFRTSTEPKPSITTSLADPYPRAPPCRGFLSRRNTPSRRSAASSAPNASATSAETGTGVPSSTAPAAPSPVPGFALLSHHAEKNIPKAAATTGSSFPGSYRARSPLPAAR